MLDPTNFNIDTRPFGILWTLRSLEKYLEVTEAQMEEVQRIERHTLKLEHLSNADDDEHGAYLRDLEYLDDHYDRDLRPAMRYSFVVLVHIAFETKIRSFCSRIQRDLKLPEIETTNVRGGTIDKYMKFLTQRASIPVQDFTEWKDLRTLQKVRDCIVHTYGRVAESRDKSFLRKLATQGGAFGIDDDGRIAISKGFCEQQLAGLRALFNRLFLCVGWKP